MRRAFVLVLLVLGLWRRRWPGRRSGGSTTARRRSSPRCWATGKGVRKMEDGIPISRGPYKIAEGESPYPQNRVYGNYNYFGGVSFPYDDIQRQTIGFEQTLFDGEASIGLRLPFFQPEFSSAGSVLAGRLPAEAQGDHVGNLTILTKLVLLETPDTILSTGLVVVAPTSDVPYLYILEDQDTPTFADDVVEGRSHSTLLEPYLGYGWFGERWFVHGFTSIMVPMDSRDVTTLFNDIGVGYRLPVGGAWITELVPTFEVHVNNPLNQRDRLVDSVDLTAGTHLVFAHHTSLGLGVATNVTRPQLFEIEGIANFTWRY